MSIRIPIALAVVATLPLCGCEMFMDEADPVAGTHTTRPAVLVAATDPEFEQVRYPRMEQGWYPFAATAPLGPEEFLRRAVTGGMLEVELARLAEQRASSERVRTFAARMAHDHSLANQRLAEIAGSHSIRIPERMNLQQQDVLDSLAAAPDGLAFDLRYMRLMVQEHERMVTLFDRQSRDESMPLLQVAISGMLPMLQEHLRAAEHVLEELQAAEPALPMPTQGPDPEEPAEPQEPLEPSEPVPDDPVAARQVAAAPAIC